MFELVTINLNNISEVLLSLEDGTVLAMETGGEIVTISREQAGNLMERLQISTFGPVNLSLYKDAHEAVMQAKWVNAFLCRLLGTSAGYAADEIADLNAVARMALQIGGSEADMDIFIASLKSALSKAGTTEIRLAVEALVRRREVSYWDSKAGMIKYRAVNILDLAAQVQGLAAISHYESLLNLTLIKREQSNIPGFLADVISMKAAILRGQIYLFYQEGGAKTADSDAIYTRELNNIQLLSLSLDPFAKDEHGRTMAAIVVHELVHALEAKRDGLTSTAGEARAYFTEAFYEALVEGVNVVEERYRNKMGKKITDAGARGCADNFKKMYGVDYLAFDARIDDFMHTCAVSVRNMLADVKAGRVFTPPLAEIEEQYINARASHKILAACCRQDIVANIDGFRRAVATAKRTGRKLAVHGIRLIRSNDKITAAHAAYTLPDDLKRVKEDILKSLKEIESAIATAWNNGDKTQLAYFAGKEFQGSVLDQLYTMAAMYIAAKRELDPSYDPMSDLVLLLRIKAIQTRAGGF